MLGVDDQKAVQECEQLAWDGFEMLGLANHAFATFVHAYESRLNIYVVLSTISMFGRKYVSVPVFELAKTMANGMFMPSPSGSLESMRLLPRRTGVTLPTELEGRLLLDRGVLAYRYKMQAAVRDALVSATSLEQIAHLLRASWTEVKPHLNAGRLTGLAFSDSTKAFRACQLGYGFTVHALRARFGVSLRLGERHKVVRTWLESFQMVDVSSSAKKINSPI